jgi:hypothetical protein
MKHHNKKEKDPEALLKSLRRLPGNLICPNCGAVAEFGWAYN